MPLLRNVEVQQNLDIMVEMHCVLFYG